MPGWWTRLRARVAPEPEIDDAGWRQLLGRSGLGRRLDDARQARLRALTERFLREKAITPAADLAFADDRRWLVAALCCLPVLELGYDWLRGWHQVIVYPGQFRVRRSHADEASGVVSEWDDELAGEAWDQGPLVLSWADVKQDLVAPQPGFHLVAHEIAHKLDALDGVMDGTPPLPAAARRDWVAAMQPAFDALRTDLDAGRPTAIDDYAAEGPDEFFAVVSEYHFSAPGLLAEQLPAVAAQLARFYGPSPFADG